MAKQEQEKIGKHHVHAGGYVHAHEHTVPEGEEPVSGEQFPKGSVHAGGYAHHSDHTIPAE